ncbi:succinate dehydrogenase assembly factor 1, mitochondrial isoform X2 [Talpa occidentalis]|uniref:succinate dehydrogenase assembly factor 1, mitochondrial isoform X2 n=1 Tax=Talpa occidentalis TaxID=50954 RepID=UPI0023F83573|nr:succinate dehydrogenase assembly factor 1, mitochondrial isoform X2 [Talpa occidentalis]
MSRPSRLQRQVLSLYRELLRAGRGKPGAEARVRAEFRQNASLPRSDVLRIEYLYRRGRRQLQLLRSSHATALGAFVRLRDPTEDPRGMGTSPDDDKRRRGALDGPGAPENPSNRRTQKEDSRLYSRRRALIRYQILDFQSPKLCPTLFQNHHLMPPVEARF